MSWLLVPASRFSEHAAAWDALQARSTDTPFLESHFIAPLLQQFGSGREMLALHTKDGQTDAATLVRPAGRGMWETFQPSQLPLGPWLSAGTDDLAQRMRSLISGLPGLALGLGATQMDPRLAPRPAEARDLRSMDYIHTSFVEIDGNFDAYWNARGKNLRQNAKKQRNKLAAEGIEPVLSCITSPDGVAQALQHYGALESAGWKAGLGTAIHPDNAQGRFYRTMLEAFCAAGRGRIYQYAFGEKVVAMDLCIDNGPMVVILKTAYDESYRAVSPSTLMRQQQFEAWWHEGRYKRIEFYGKTLEWHTRWTDSGRVLYHATAFRWPLLRSLQDRLKAVRAAPEPEPAQTTDV